MLRFIRPALAGLLLSASHAGAVTITATLASTVSTAPFALANFGDAGRDGFVSAQSIALRNGTITFGTGGSLSAGVYDGNVGNVVSSPRGYGNYLAAEPGSSITFSFNQPQTTFQLLWGSVDSYNSLLFTRTDGSSLSVTGSDIQAVDGSTGSAYVTLANLGAFSSVTAISTTPAFEFIPNVQVPEPGTLALLGVGLAGLAWFRRRPT